MTVIESARRAAGLSQRRLAELARTQQSSVSEYEKRRKSPTLEVVERLLDAADAELTTNRRVDFVYLEDPVLEFFAVPNRLWQLPVPRCFDRVQFFPFMKYADGKEIWDLSDPAERIEFYELALCYGPDDALVETVDGALLVEAWPNMSLPDSVRAAWQPLIDEAKGGASSEDPPLDPAGYNARIAAQIGVVWPRKGKAWHRIPVTD